MIKMLTQIFRWLFILVISGMISTAVCLYFPYEQLGIHQSATFMVFIISNLILINPLRKYFAVF